MLQQQQTSSPTERNVPIESISKVISISQFANYVFKLSDDELKPLFRFLPDGIEHSKPELIRVIQSPFFLNSLETFSSALREVGTGVGSVVAHELGYEYQGEGIEGFLEGTRKQGKKEQEKEDK